MADNWISTGNDVARLQNMLRQGLTGLVVAVNQITAVNNIMAQMTADDGTGTEIETAFGIKTGEGNDAHTVLGSAATALADPRIVAALQRLG